MHYRIIEVDWYGKPIKRTDGLDLPDAVTENEANEIASFVKKQVSDLRWWQAILIED
jgi:hypothetical protein